MSDVSINTAGERSVTSTFYSMMTSLKTGVLVLLPDETGAVGKAMTLAKGIFWGTAPHAMTILPMYLSTVISFNVRAVTGIFNSIVVGNFIKSLIEAKKFTECLDLVKYQGLIAAVNVVALMRLVDLDSLSPEHRLMLDTLFLATDLFLASRAIHSGVKTIQSGLYASESSTGQKIANLVSGFISTGLGVLGLASTYRSALDLYDRNHCPKDFLCECGPESERYNYLCKPGFHSETSPVLGSRNHELAIIRNSPTNLSYLLSDLEKEIYQGGNARKIIKKEDGEKALIISREMYSRFLDKYRSQGITEVNAVKWLEQPCGTFDTRIQIETGPWSVRARVCQGIYPIIRDSEYVNIDGLGAIHELMHVQELAHGFSASSEVMTITNDIMRMDEIYKRIHDIGIGREVDYGQTIKLRGKEIPLGKYANFYRGLETSKPNLAEAIVSQESIDFLTDPLIEAERYQGCREYESHEECAPYFFV